MSQSSTLIASISQDGMQAISTDLGTAISLVTSSIENLTAVANLSKALASFGFADAYELINSAISGLQLAKADITEVLTFVKPIDHD